MIKRHFLNSLHGLCLIFDEVLLLDCGDVCMLRPYGLFEREDVEAGPALV